MRRCAASSVASRTAAIDSGRSRLNDWSRYVARITPLSVAIPKSAKKPTHTATLKFNG